jgi:hypothetical protein
MIEPRTVAISVEDPDSMGPRIQIRKPDPDPGGQKWPTKIEKN